MKELILLLSLFCNGDKYCMEEITECSRMKIRDYVEITEYVRGMEVKAFYECLVDTGRV